MTQDSKPGFINPNYNLLSEEAIEKTVEETISKNKTGITVIDAANELEKEIYNDHLTDFENRKGLNRYKNSLRPDQYPITMISIDLDNLKKVNDNYGHPAGDKYILSFVKFINEIFPDNKKFRLGGDEFFIPISNLDSEKNKSLLDPENEESLYNKLKAFNDRENPQNELQFTFETDIAHSDEDFYSAFKRSDDKLIESKKNKKDGQSQILSNS